MRFLHGVRLFTATAADLFTATEEAEAEVTQWLADNTSSSAVKSVGVQFGELAGQVWVVVSVNYEYVRL